jgi:hypothetical protein
MSGFLRRSDALEAATAELDRVIGHSQPYIDAVETMRAMRLHPV